MTEPPPLPPAPARLPSVRVWDPVVRLLHWGLALAVAVAWFSGEETLSRHEWAGHASMLAVALRTIWGFVGTPRARFADFVRSPRVVRAYAISIRRHVEARHLGHNPLGGWMIVALMTTVLATGLTGWLYTLDAFWGLAWLEWTHRALAWILVALVVLHVTGVVFSSRRHRENLLLAMLTGRKREE